jgi:transcriptional regulator with XRE-family HTH domain
MASRLTPSQAVARSVKRARQLQNWNQQQLAHRLTELGLPTRQSTIARIETGKRGVSLDDAVALSVALDVPLVRLIAGQAVDDEQIALAPAEVFPAELARLHLVGSVHLGSPANLSTWWKGHGEKAREEGWFERAKEAGRVRTDTASDGTTTYVVEED